MLDLGRKNLFDCKELSQSQEVRVNKSELVEAVGSTAGLDKREAERAVEAFVGTVMDEVKGGNKVTLIGFGTFNPTARGARTGRNPQTGEPVKVGASKGVSFKAGTAFKSLLNTKGAAKRTPAKATAKSAAPAARASSARGAAGAPAAKAPAAGGTKAAGPRAGAPAGKAARSAAPSRKR